MYVRGLGAIKVFRMLSLTWVVSVFWLGIIQKLSIFFAPPPIVQLWSKACPGPSWTIIHLFNISSCLTFSIKLLNTLFCLTKLLVMLIRFAGSELQEQVGPSIVARFSAFIWFLSDNSWTSCRCLRTNINVSLKVFSDFKWIIQIWLLNLFEAICRCCEVEKHRQTPNSTTTQLTSTKHNLKSG